MNNPQETYQLKVGDSIFTFGDKCPQIKSIFFPNDNENKEEKTTQLGDQDDSPQPS